ncbi:MAG: alpha/beta fold hydrolase [Planctomycetota bacterium]|nr:MAG: alpha/beta fold hydrolase [Planctomycetota bacterium]
MRPSLLLALLFGCLGGSVAAQEGPPPPQEEEVVWEVRFRGEGIGTERASRKVLADGRVVLRSRGDMKLPAAPPFRYEQKLEQDARGLVRYQLTSSMISAGAERTKNGAVLSRTYLGNEGRREVKGRGPFFCLDNLVWSHYDLLAGAAQARDHAPFEAVFLVPQGDGAVKAAIKPGPPVQAEFDGRSCTVRVVRLALAGVLAELTYDAERGRALRVVVPPNFEARVRGFVPPPATAQPSEEVRWREEEVRFPAPQGPLPGTLTLPLAAAGEAPFPCVLFLHGSGPSDRDETVGPNKPFRDLARGLAARGVASLRYDKRTLLLQKDFFAGGEAARRAAKCLERLTLEEEVLSDARAACAWLKARGEFGSLFLLGHSLGALAAPEVAAGVEDLAGLVLLAAPGRPLDVLVTEQLVYKQRLAGLGEDEARAKVDETVGAQWRALRAGKLPDMARILGATAHYWKDLLSRDPPLRALGACRLPVLLLQGSKDYQVTRVDYEATKAALAAREGVPFEARWFEGLNHLFMPVEGRSTGAEYMIEGRVAADVVELIAEWVKKRSRRGTGGE